ncbi:hypothetical protein QBC47DRAFT_345959 [Echria macrotheca]|uniref:tRNA(Ile)-lysidine synthetase n=1 Tax=Echria macrotheca TaxID=438768 RepID=A0AAJ0B9U6_9PEZI|nr:hypothetical protein QBC47DRAFT_345959 [Echria macrotheca]
MTAPVLHRSAKAISNHEFAEALRATCLPRYPLARGTSERHVALAISGGVDSMALAFLCSRLKKTTPSVRLSDNVVGAFWGITISHGLRAGSRDEADRVGRVLTEQLGMKHQIKCIDWDEILEKDVNPAELPNIETLARRMRYRNLGLLCGRMGVGSLLTAHNEDDQYETVLMRMLTGRGYQAMQGMRPGANIPECYDMHGVYESGFLDDQRRKNPYYNLRPNKYKLTSMKYTMREQVNPVLVAREIELGMPHTSYLDSIEHYRNAGKKDAPPMPKVEVEDGGVMVYKPLLEFSKDRLTATCLENGVPWFEDHTNADPTFTLRNAVRHMYKNHELPVALQKPAILRLAARCRARVLSEEDQAKRMSHHVCIRDFDPNAGTAVIQMRRFVFPQVPRKLTGVRRQYRLENYRFVAALLLREVLPIVSPEREIAHLGHLDTIVSLLFPSLRRPSEPPVAVPKPFNFHGVYFVPLVGGKSLRWLISREPHSVQLPRPAVWFSAPRLESRMKKHPRRWKQGDWSEWRLYDNRFWIRAKSRLPCKVRVAPYEEEHAKPFRESLVEAKGVLSSLLKRHAPGKIRYTLPAMYADFNVTDVLEGGDYWLRDRDYTEVLDGAPALPEDENRDGLFAKRKWEERKAAEGKPQLIALPTLGVGLPRLDEWFEYEVRYRKVDYELLHRNVLDRLPEQRRIVVRWTRRRGGRTERRRGRSGI